MVLPSLFQHLFSFFLLISHVQHCYVKIHISTYLETFSIIRVQYSHDATEVISV